MMSKAFTCLLVLLVAQLCTMATAVSIQKRQAPNTLYQKYPQDMTSAVNGTVNVIPIPKALAQRLAGGRSLLTPTGLPAGFLKADEHLLVINDQYQTDIRQNFLVDLRVDSLPTLTASIPFVDAAKDNKTAFSYNVGSWVPQLLPSLVATLSGHKDTLAHFEPLAAAYATIGNNQFLLEVFTGLDNPVDGPGLLEPVFQSRFSAAPRGKLSARNFKDLISQPVLRQSGKCDAQYVYVFDGPFAAPFFAKADIQTGKGITRTPMTFSNVESWSISYNWAAPAGAGSDCEKVARG